MKCTCPSCGTNFNKDMNLGKLEEGTQHRKMICVLCHEVIESNTDPFGHNPWPLASKGRCCGNCNRNKVIPRRIAGKPYNRGTLGVIDEQQAI